MHYPFDARATAVARRMNKLSSSRQVRFTFQKATVLAGRFQCLMNAGENMLTRLMTIRDVRFWANPVDLSPELNPASSEAHLHRKLDLPCACCEVRSFRLGTRLTESAGIGCEVSGLAKLDAIEQVIALRTEL